MAKDFFFAWTNPGVVFNPAVHNVKDEDIFSFKMGQSEGDFAWLELVIKNPRIGLLNPARKVHGIFSMNIGTDLVPVYKPLLRGRLIGVPDNMFETLVTIKFSARPDDFVAQKAALAASLRVAPFWSSIWLAPEAWADDDAVLEAYSAFWHIDPVTHLVTISDVLIPEDGVIDFPASKVFYDGVTVALQTAPKRSCEVTATIPWTQSDVGGIDLTNTILSNYPIAPGGGRGLGGLITSFTFEGLSGSWPKLGSRIGDGWVVASGSLDDQSFLAAPEFVLPNYFDAAAAAHAIPAGSIVFAPKNSGRIWGGVDGAGFDTTQEIVIVPLGWGRPELSVSYAAKRELGQTVHFILKTAMQSIVTLASEDEPIQIKLTANKVSDVTIDSTIPIVDVRARDFVHSDNGRLEVEHLGLLARAHLRIAARAVKATFPCALLDGIDASTRKGALLHDDRLPGGTAGGKITDYLFELDGTNGSPVATIAIGCAIGYGGSYSEAAGDPLYVDPGYVDPGYQEYTNVVTLLDTSDITYSLPPTDDTYDDGIDFQRGLTPAHIVQEITVINAEADQRAAILAAVPDIGDQGAASAALHLVPTRISLKLAPLTGGPFMDMVEVGWADLIVPKQIDLEAPSV